MSVTFHQLKLLLLARVHNELKSVVIAVGREVQFDEAALRDEQSTALDLAAEEARVARVVQGRGPVVNLRACQFKVNQFTGSASSAAHEHPLLMLRLRSWVDLMLP
jgi:hypothetical protein